ncbi:MAG: hypothetical protein MPI93_04420 [Nitrosopumilus sp.]|nr:hypothetical protein [Nitrosopumilus sp.]
MNVNNRTKDIRDIFIRGDKIYILDGVGSGKTRAEGVTDEVERVLARDYNYPIDSYTEIITELKRVLEGRDIIMVKIGEKIKNSEASGLTEEEFNLLQKVDKKIAGFTKNVDGNLATFERKLFQYRNNLNYKCKKLKHVEKFWTEREQIEFRPTPKRVEIVESDKTGVIMLEEGMYKEAIRFFGKKLAMYPNDANIQSYMGTALSLLGRNHDAVVECHRPIDECDSYIALYNIGRTLHSMEQDDMAVKYLKRASEMDIETMPKKIRANILSYMGSSLGRQRSFDNALSLHEEAISIDESYITLYNKGHTLYQQGNNIRIIFSDEAKEKYNLALDCFIDANEKEKDNPIILSSIGLVKSAIGRLDSSMSAKYFKESEEDHNQALKLDERNARIHFNKGISLLRMDKFEDAIKCFEIADRRKPWNSDVHNAMKNAYKLRDGNMHKYKQRLRIQGEFAEFDRGNYWFLQYQDKRRPKEDLKRVVDDFEKHLRKNPGDTVTEIQIVLVLLELDKPDKALKYCEIIFKKNPEDGMAKKIYHAALERKKDLNI